VLDLIEKKPHGLLNLLDEEVRLPKGDEDKWLAKCQANHSTNPNWKKDNTLQRSVFVVVHYAGVVCYDSAGFCEKNKDSLFRDLYDLMSGAAHPNYKVLFPEKDKNPRRVDTLSGGFRKQLNNLMDVCNSTQPHYIRCIKPNNAKVPRTFQSQMCLEQLTYAGVFEAVQIRKTGYPFRLAHSRFASRYRYLMKKKYGTITLPEGQEMKQACAAILGSVTEDLSRVQIGRTMVLYRAEEHRLLELLRNLFLDRIYSIVQRHVRRYIGKKFLKAFKRVKSICQRALSQNNGMDPNLLGNAIQMGDEAISYYRVIYNYEPYHLVTCRHRKAHIEERVKLTVEFRRLRSLNPLDHFEEFGLAIARADQIQDVQGTPDDIALEKEIREATYRAAKAKIEPLAARALELFDIEDMRVVIKHASQYSYSSPSIEELIKWVGISERIDPWADRAYSAYDKADMEKVVADADGCGYVSDRLKEIKVWLEAVAQIELRAQESLNNLSKAHMEGSLQEAEEYTYDSPCIVEIKATLGLPEDKFVRKQLVRAKEMGDEDRRINREIRLKDIFLQTHKEMFRFERSTCKIIREEGDWASFKLFALGRSKVELAEGMLRHTINPIHQTLTLMDNSKDAKEGTKQFKNLMGFMGDRKYQCRLQSLFTLL
jgi:hypothetical protein